MTSPISPTAGNGGGGAGTGPGGGSGTGPANPPMPPPPDSYADRLFAAVDEIRADLEPLAHLDLPARRDPAASAVAIATSGEPGPSLPSPPPWVAPRRAAGLAGLGVGPLYDALPPATWAGDRWRGIQAPSGRESTHG